MDSLILVDGGSNDVQDVMCAVGAAVQRWEAQQRDGPGTLATSVPLVAAPPAAATDELVRRLPLEARVDGNAIIHSTRPRLGPWLIRFQVLVRRLSWWFVEPVLQQIRGYQADSARAIGGLAQEQAALGAEVTALRTELADLHARLGQSGAPDGGGRPTAQDAGKEDR